VTAQLETNRLPVGGSTTLHVFAQIAPDYRGGYARIFSWNVDALLSGSPAGRFDPATLVRPNSDNDPQSSSAGTVDDRNLRSIRDSFLNSTNAGRDTPVELFSVALLALAPGSVYIALQPGTFADEPDFTVDPIGEGPTLTGGDYQQAHVQLDMYAPLEFSANISQTVLPANQGRLITISFPTSSGFNYTVESVTNTALPTPQPIWQPLPNSPHNQGFADDTNSVPRRFYRVRAMPKI
jgi:hypothetical protein